jgi:hypothetical protein
MRKTAKKEKQDNPNWGGRVDTDIHEKLEKSSTKKVGLRKRATL